MTPRTAVDIEATKRQMESIALLRGKLLSDLLGLAHEQCEMLISGEHTSLAENIQSQDRCLAELESLDRQEAPLLQALPADIMHSAPEFYRNYVELAGNASLTAENLKSIAQSNRELFENAMRYVAFSLGAISNLAVNQPSYDPRFDASVGGSAIVFDLKV